MADSNSMVPKQESEQQAEHALVAVHLPPDLLAALDRYAREHEDMTRPQALRSAFREWAVAHGYAPSADEGTRPEDLNASNDD